MSKPTTHFTKQQLIMPECEGVMKAHEAARDGDIETINRLNRQNLEIADEHGRTPMHYAALYGNWKIVSDALRLKGFTTADLLAEDDFGLTPIHFAAMCGDGDIFNDAEITDDDLKRVITKRANALPRKMENDPRYLRVIAMNEFISSHIDPDATIGYGYNPAKIAHFYGNPDFMVELWKRVKFFPEDTLITGWAARLHLYDETVLAMLFDAGLTTEEMSEESFGRKSLIEYLTMTFCREQDANPDRFPRMLESMVRTAKPNHIEDIFQPLKSTLTQVLQDHKDAFEEWKINRFHAILNGPFGEDLLLPHERAKKMHEVLPNIPLDLRNIIAGYAAQQDKILNPKPVEKTLEKPLVNPPAETPHQEAHAVQITEITISAENEENHFEPQKIHRKFVEQIIAKAKIQNDAEAALLKYVTKKYGQDSTSFKAALRLGTENLDDAESKKAVINFIADLQSREAIKNINLETKLPGIFCCFKYNKKIAVLDVEALEKDQAFYAANATAASAKTNASRNKIVPFAQEEIAPQNQQAPIRMVNIVRAEEEMKIGDDGRQHYGREYAITPSTSLRAPRIELANQSRAQSLG